MATTTIQVTDDTLERMRYFKEYSKESYDEILNKMIDAMEEGELTETANKKILAGLEDIKNGLLNFGIKGLGSCCSNCEVKK